MAVNLYQWQGCKSSSGQRLKSVSLYPPGIPPFSVTFAVLGMPSPPSHSPLPSPAVRNMPFCDSPTFQDTRDPSVCHLPCPHTSLPQPSQWDPNPVLLTSDVLGKDLSISWFPPPKNGKNSLWYCEGRLGPFVSRAWHICYCLYYHYY